MWKRNRNAYTRLLSEQLRAGRLAPPFDAAPPGAPLPTLPRALAYPFTPPRPRPRAGGDAGALHGSPAPAAGARTPSEELDAYLARRAAGLGWADDPGGGLGGASGGGAAASLAEDEQGGLFGGGADGGRRALEAALGAARERQAELEWRLARAEAQLRRAGGAEIAGGGYDARVVAEVLERAERRTRGSPARVGGGGGAAPPAKPPAVSSPERAVRLRQFAARTDEIKRRLGMAAEALPPAPPLAEPHAGGGNLLRAWRPPPPPPAAQPPASSASPPLALDLARLRLGCAPSLGATPSASPAGGALEPVSPLDSGAASAPPPWSPGCGHGATARDAWSAWGAAGSSGAATPAAASSLGAA